MRRRLRNHALSIVAFSCFLVFWILQAYFGWVAENSELAEHGRSAQSLWAYLGSGGFAEATFENWESEFLQMGAYVLLTAALVERGSAESRAPESTSEHPDRTRPDAPWPVRRGGIWRWLYSHSLSMALLSFFVLSFAGHLLGGTAEHNDQRELHGLTPVSVWRFAGDAEFWFQSMQNWQSEFLAVGALIVLSIVFRERDSPESKRVDAPWSETGQ